MTVWRVVSAPTPWWITPEVYCCAAGHAELYVRAAPAQGRPARRWPSLVRPWWIGLVPSRSFVLGDHCRRSVGERGRDRRESGLRQVRAVP